MNEMRIRRAPPLWILLDILMLWILALLSTPIEEQGISYKFLGLPVSSILFEVDVRINQDQVHWRHFDFDKKQWVDSNKISPHGRENFLCNECAEFLPDGALKPKGLMVGLPSEIRPLIHEAFFDACGGGDCSPTLFINQNGSVSASRQDQ